MASLIIESNSKRRLQGVRYYYLRPRLTLIGYEISSHGNIKAIMRVKTQCRKMHKGWKGNYFHWLSDDEIETFINSDYYKNNPARKISDKISLDILKRLKYNY